MRVHFVVAILCCWLLTGCGDAIIASLDLLPQGDAPDTRTVVFSTGYFSDIGDAYNDCGFDAACFDRYIRASRSTSTSNGRRKHSQKRGAIHVLRNLNNTDGSRLITYGEAGVPDFLGNIPPDYATLTLEYNSAGEVIRAKLWTTRTADGVPEEQTRTR